MINLYSDTQTKPTDAMRRAMAHAEVGDEQRREDPTVERLCEVVAQRLGMEAALFLPSGVMCNLIALKTHTVPGDVLYADHQCHILRAECGGPGVACGVMIDAFETATGQFTGDDLRRRVGHNRLGRYSPPPRLVCVEQTHNFAGGTVWTTDGLRGVVEAARELGLRTHMDGARLANAAVAAGVPMAEMTRGFDSVWLDFSKGLGAPVGAALAGSAAFVEQARRYKHLFGGAMRQAGIVAAGALHGLEHHYDRLAEDHEHAALLADAVEAADHLSLIHGRPATNIVFFRVNGDVDGDGDGDVNGDAAAYAAKLRGAGLDVSELHGSLRAVTHLDVTRGQVGRACGLLRDTLP